MNKLLIINYQSSFWDGDGVLYKPFKLKRLNSGTQCFIRGHVLQLDKLKEWQLCNKPPDCMPPARNKLKGKTNTTITLEPSPITSDLSNYQHLQKQLFHFWTGNAPANFLWIKPEFWKGNIWESFIWTHSIYKMYNLCIAAIKCTKCLLCMIYDRNGCMPLI